MNLILIFFNFNLIKNKIKKINRKFTFINNNKITKHIYQISKDKFNLTF